MLDNLLQTNNMNTFYCYYISSTVNLDWSQIQTGWVTWLRTACVLLELLARQRAAGKRMPSCPYVELREWKPGNGNSWIWARCDYSTWIRSWNLGPGMWLQLSSRSCDGCSLPGHFLHFCWEEIRKFLQRFTINTFKKKKVEWGTANHGLDPVHLILL